MNEKIAEIKNCIILEKAVRVKDRYGELIYIPREFVYWYGKKDRQWHYSVTLIDPELKRSVVTVPIEDIEFIKE